MKARPGLATLPPALVSGAAVVAVIGGIAWAATPSGSAATPPPAAAAAPAAAPAAVPARGPREPGRSTEKPIVGTKRQAPVGVDRDSELRTGVTVRVSGGRSLTLTGQGPGDLGGPGLSFTVTVRNNSSTALDLGAMAVNATVGTLPASPSDAPPAKPLAGSLAPGGRASGTYVVALPDTSARDLHVEVQFNTSERVLTFDAR